MINVTQANRGATRAASPASRSQKPETSGYKLMYLLRFGFPILASFFFVTASLAQTVEEPPTVDPLDALCASIDRPVTEQELADFSGYVVHSISSSYTEVLGRFREGRTRSVRYLSDDRRTAQYVQINDREISFAPNGSGAAVRGVPLVCTSGEADFVMVDENDRPYARIDKPKESDAPVDGNDWVAFAGGSTRMVIENTRFRNRGATRARNIASNDRCKVGAGYPGLDQAYAYFWGAENCGSAYASGANSVVYITRDGDIQSTEFGSGTGIKTENGNLYWSFAQPVALAVECSNADDTQIPQLAADVKKIVARITVSADVNIAEPLVYTRLVFETDQYIERICGIRPIPNQTEYLFERSGATDEENVDLSLVLLQNALGVRTAESPAYRQRAEAITNAAQNVSNASRFAVFIRQFTESERQANMLRILRENGRLASLADGVRASDVGTLVALSEGLTIRMPWAGLNPTFSDGKFQITWNEASSDPVNEFFRSRRQKEGWRAIERRVPAAQNRVSIRLTCYLPASEANSIPADNYVDVEATLISHNASNFVFGCKAP